MNKSLKQILMLFVLICNLNIISGDTRDSKDKVGVGKGGHSGFVVPGGCFKSIPEIAPEGRVTSPVSPAFNNPFLCTAAFNYTANQVAASLMARVSSPRPVTPSIEEKDGQ